MAERGITTKERTRRQDVAGFGADVIREAAYKARAKKNRTR
ncbi:MAG TPA: hypothetical protein VJH37_04745 [Candidatus Nanoarchaeia archaeon]|nr:hypothetical protein [Candidatus Nanoarchaeia archaeon]